MLSIAKTPSVSVDGATNWVIDDQVSQPDGIDSRRSRLKHSAIHPIHQSLSMRIRRFRRDDVCYSMPNFAKLCIA